MTEYKRVREEVAKWVFLPLCGVPDEIDIEWDFCRLNMQQNCRYIAGQILSLNGIEIKSDDQSLPNADRLKAELKKQGGYHTARTKAYAICQEDMLKVDKEGRHFIKVAPKEAN